MHGPNFKVDGPIKVDGPNFFIVGAPKAGTTALYAYLGQHPQVYMSPLKEPNYFAEELRPENVAASERPRVEREMRSLQQYLQGDLREKRFGGLVSDWDQYQRLFHNAAAGEIARGEASACYLWSRTAPGNIARHIPAAKIIMNLRNPVDRAFSQYLQLVSAGVTRCSFREQITASLNCREHLFGPDWPLLEFGRYGEQLERYLQVFPRSQLHISFYEDLERDPQCLLRELFAFLQVDSNATVDFTLRHHQPSVARLQGVVGFLKKSGAWPYLRGLLPMPLGPRMRRLFIRPRGSLTVSPAERSLLIDYYRDDIDKLAKLLNRDLGSWL